MVLFPNCKINLGLDVLRRRPDGYHDIETFMFPVRGLTDVLEIVPAAGDGVEFSGSGLVLDCPPEKNLCLKAYELMRTIRRCLPGDGAGASGGRQVLAGVRMHLHKAIPSGAGLGGGSADAAYAVRGLNGLFGLGLDEDSMESLATRLGSDTAFFVRNVPALATGRGEVLTPFPLSLAGKVLVIVKPGVAVSTAQAYASITPRVPAVPLAERLARPLAEWRECLTNDFEAPVFGMHPILARIKRKLYDAGAVYAAMSGSGAALFGIFEPARERIGPEGALFETTESFARDIASVLEREFGPLFFHCGRME